MYRTSDSDELQVVRDNFVIKFRSFPSSFLLGFIISNFEDIVVITVFVEILKRTLILIG